jgi:hypothetical protein
MNVSRFEALFNISAGADAPRGNTGLSRRIAASRRQLRSRGFYLRFLCKLALKPPRDCFRTDPRARYQPRGRDASGQRAVRRQPRSDAEPIHGSSRSRRRQEIIRQERGDQKVTTQFADGGCASCSGRRASASDGSGNRTDGGAFLLHLRVRLAEALGADTVVVGRIAGSDQPLPVRLAGSSS